ncbi:molybdopterin molybdotransferase MoeA [Carboxylicivirga caseinilyticus]|uniref:molybdopterin molybdotransferase MoeA n=1 Tax=Carboxylicivirga caseinilyticus TaxID=3417572 RepID=UPI003D32A071|nr:molybdopterin molybdotransferase MoeA [Marinilabiliaceae bacterium A049]
MGKEQLDNQLISVEEAKVIVEKVVKPLKTESVSLTDAQGRFLAEDVLSTVYIPPFNRSAMDGFACRKEDLKRPLSLIGTLAAGDSTKYQIKEGECVRIMTGASVPDGADTVIMVENTRENDGKVEFLKDDTKSNISPKGEDLKPGDLLVCKNTLLRSSHIAALASSGIAKVEVYQKASVAIISTGSELIEPGSELLEGQIYNSNGYQLKARLKELGFDALNYGVKKDDYQTLKEEIESAVTNHDLLVVTGGVSVGDYDYIPAIVKELGFEIHFSKMSAKPGKHTLFASKEDKYILGLPGNPVSTFIQFEECGQWILHAMCNRCFQPLRIEMEIAYHHRRKRSDRFELFPVCIAGDGQIQSLTYHGSAHMHALTQANALMEIPEGINELNPGDKVYVRPL